MQTKARLFQSLGGQLVEDGKSAVTELYMSIHLVRPMSFLRDSTASVRHSPGSSQLPEIQILKNGIELIQFLIPKNSCL